MGKFPGRAYAWLANHVSWQRLGLTRRIIVWSSIAIVALVLGRLFAISLASAWHWYHLNRDDIVPLGTFAGAAVVAWAALRQARTARLRHEKQTEADRQRRITESFSKAAEQLGNDKLAVRLGGIYTMERISRESREDYWPIMETLTAFVRENARWKAPNKDASETAVHPDSTPSRQPGESGIPTDIAAVLSVICRRDKMNYEREIRMGWRFDLRGTDLRRTQLPEAHLESADIRSAHLEGASLPGAYLVGADLRSAHFEGAGLPGAYLQQARLRSSHFDGAFLAGAHLEGADLAGAHFEGVSLAGAHLEGAVLAGTHLEGASLWGAYAQKALLQNAFLEGADLRGAHFEGANLLHATGLEEAQLAAARGDEKTILPNVVARPEAWPAAEDSHESDLTAKRTRN